MNPRTVTSCPSPHADAKPRLNDRAGTCPLVGAAGFSMVEILVVTSIIIILIAVGAVATFRSLSTAARQQTRIALSVCKSIAEEYEAQTNAVINHTGTSPIDWSAAKTKNTPGEIGTGTITDTSERFTWAARSVPTTAKMLPSIGRDLLADTDANGFLEVIDGWGTKLRYTTSNNPATEDPALPDYRRQFFASAGEDRLWGTTDDLYSFDLE